jgi:serine/threonine protein kinase
VQVRAFLEEPGFAALVFEYVPGVALARLLRFCHAHGVRLPDRAAWHIVERVFAALAYAHSFKDEQGQPTPIVHRDVSPSNVLVDWTGGVKLGDFGIAKMLGVSPATRVGLVKGTLGCMAPEQARGEPVDERADVYAAALLAWRLATGRVPFAKWQKDEYELLRAMRQPRIKPLSVIRPDLPEPLLDAMAQALEPEPAQRTITAGELGDVIAKSIDVAAGWLELGTLLERWKPGPGLEATVRRAAAGEGTTSTSDRIAHTLRYEEVALAFADDVPVDGPTFEAHALPSDPSTIDAAPVDTELVWKVPTVSGPPPPPPASVELEADTISTRAVPTAPGSVRRALLSIACVIGAAVVCVLLAALLARR